MIYLDNAATTIQKPQSVYDSVLKAMKSFGNSGRSASVSALDASRVIYDTRVKISELVNLGIPSHVIFTSNSTEALNIAIMGSLSKKDHVIITEQEHNSVLRPVYALCDYSVLPINAEACLQYDKLDSLLKPNTKAVIVNHISNVTGNIANLSIFSKFAEEHQLLFIVDASQSMGEVPIDMKQNGIDILCFTGHKGLMGPQGTGGLCISEGIEILPLKRGGTGVQTFLKEQPTQYPTRLEAGTLNGHGISGLNAALQFIRENTVESIMEHERELTDIFIQQILSIPGVKIYGKNLTDRGPVVSLNIRDFDSGKVSEVLMEKYGIATRSGAMCAPLLIHALNADHQGVVRFSFGYYNTEADVNAAVRAIWEISQ